MKKSILVLISIVFSIGLNAQNEMAKVSKETRAINKKIDLAMQHWKQYPMSDFPDIGAIIKNEIESSIKRKLGVVGYFDMEDYANKNPVPIKLPNLYRLPKSATNKSKR